MRMARAAAVLVTALTLTAAAVAGMYKPGDMAVVKTDKAAVKQGSDVIGRLAKGTRIKIHYVHAQGGFALVYIKLGGKHVKGYIRLADLEPPAEDEVKVRGTGYRPLDKIVVEATQAKLMKGKIVLGRVPKGTALTVMKVRGDWLGVKAEIGGKKIFGWLHSRDVDYAPSDDAEDDEPAKDHTKPKTDADAKTKDARKDGATKDKDDEDWMK